MKKIILSVFCFLVCLIMVGCSSNSDTQALKNLNSQLDRVSEIVSSTSTSEVSEVSPSFSQPYTNTTYQLPRLRENAYQNMIQEEELRQNVLSLSAYLKGNQTKEYKLGKNKANALNDLSSNLSKYASYLNSTKENIKNSVNKIKKSTRIQSLDIEQAKAAYIELGNNMNERLSYLSNLYNTLSEISYMLDNSLSENKNTQNKTTEDTNILNYNNYSNDQNISAITSNENNKASNIDTFNNTAIKNNNSQYLQNQYLNNNNYNDYNYWHRRNNNFNPNRNTDTFYPKYRNIDTFRYNPNRNDYYNNYQIENNNLNNQSILTTTEENQQTTRKFNKNSNNEQSQTNNINNNSTNVQKENKIKKEDVKNNVIDLNKYEPFKTMNSNINKTAQNL